MNDVHLKIEEEVDIEQVSVSLYKLKQINDDLQSDK